MDSIQNEAMRKELVEKLHPKRIKTSGKMTAFLGYLLGEHFADPQITTLTITSDGYMLVGDMANEHVGLESDLVRNINGISDVAGLSAEERKWLLARIPKRAGTQ